MKGQPYRQWRQLFTFWQSCTDVPQEEQAPLLTVRGLTGQAQQLALAMDSAVLGQPRIEEDLAVTPPVVLQLSGIELLLAGLDDRCSQNQQDRAFDLSKRFLELQQERGETVTSYAARFHLALDEA